jgi:hypothetical protein
VLLMLDSLIVPVLVTTDLPPEADLAEFGTLLTGAARALPYDCSLAGAVFWLDRPLPARRRPPAELRFAALLGRLSVAGRGHTARAVVADVRHAASAAVTSRYGGGTAAPAVLAIRERDIRERTPDTALHISTLDTAPDLVAAARTLP